MSGVLAWIIPIIIMTAVGFSICGLVVTSFQIIIKKIRSRHENA